MQLDPALHSDPDRGDLVLPAVTLVVSAYPHSDPILAPLATDVEDGKRADQPFFQRGDVAAYIVAAMPQVEHQVGNALAGPMVGELAAAAGLMHRKARLDQVRGL